jgi:phenylpyruvate tautomerase PptA (4-oxalocrotonate tautomerase family)
MPCTRIETGEGWIRGQHQAVIEAVQQALLGALKLPDSDRDIVLYEHPAHARIIPRGRSPAYTRIEVVLFSGRSHAAKRRLYAMICDNLAALGVPRDDIKVVLVESPRENWGIRGGKSAADVDLGFEIGV